jgi:hypothetical protein
MAGPIVDKRFKSHIGARNADGFDEDLIDVRLIFGKPIEKQQNRVDLVVMSAIRKAQEFALEICKP